MIMKNHISLLLFFFFLFSAFFSSCVSNRLLKKDEFLYTGAKIKLHSDTTIDGKSTLKGLLKDDVYPLPNTRFIGIPLRLWVYKIMGKPTKTKGLRYYLKFQYGEPPVLLSSVPTDEVTESLQKLLKGNGYLDSRVNSEVRKVWLSKKNKRIMYHCYLRPPYHIGKYHINIADTTLNRLLEARSQRALIHEGDQYNLNKLKGERERIDRILKNRGYFYFSPEFIVFKADSALPHRKMDLTMQLRDDIDPSFLKPWYVNDVLVNENTTIDSLASRTTTVDSIRFTGGKTFRPEVISRFILFKEGKLITSKDYSSTVKNLSTIGAFKFTNVNFDPDSSGHNRVNINIDIVPYKRKNISTGANLITRSTDFAGPGVDITFLNRNLFRGAEQLTLKANGSIEAWLKKTQEQTIGSYNSQVGTSAELNIPYFLMLNSSLFSPRFIPYTNFTLDYKLVNQIQFYKMSILHSSFGYRWHETEEKYHELNVVDISYQHVSKRTARFIAQLDSDQLLRHSFEDQFILGSNYTFQYSLPHRDPRKIKPLFTGSIELSGNLLYGLQKLTKATKSTDSAYLFFGTPYSQYAKTTADLRVYFDITKKYRIATRVLTGVGIPFGNSVILPSIKQYFSGGSNSIRAFQLRSVGPGLFSRDSISTDQTGDIRLEGNIENRFLLAKQLEFALFLDVGNIWLARNDPQRPGAQFKFNTFYKELAVGWGYGLRYLNEYFTLRLDVGYPLRTPNPSNLKGQKNTVWNFAIGYPF
jgi:outer membrane protein insertion porin family